MTEVMSLLFALNHLPLATARVASISELRESSSLRLPPSVNSALNLLEKSSHRLEWGGEYKSGTITTSPTAAATIPLSPFALRQMPTAPSPEQRARAAALIAAKAAEYGAKAAARAQRSRNGSSESSPKIGSRGSLPSFMLYPDSLPALGHRRTRTLTSSARSLPKSGAWSPAARAAVSGALTVDQPEDSSTSGIRLHAGPTTGVLGLSPRAASLGQQTQDRVKSKSFGNFLSILR